MHFSVSLTAHDVAAALRARDPGLGALKLQQLLYYCQGHHLATFGTPLFAETISAWDHGPVVGELWYAEQRGVRPTSSEQLDEAGLNTVGYVLSRYGNLSGGELERLAHSEPPWQRADATRGAGGSVPIEQQWMLEYFRSPAGAGTDDAEVALDSDAVKAWLAGAELRRTAAPRPDDLEQIRARLVNG